jgi:predicted transcriptional regulator
MIGADQLLSASLEKIIRSNLGDATVLKIQDRLFEKFGISMTQSMEEFDKLDFVLREFFGAGAEGLERRFLDSVCSIKSNKDQIQKRFTIKDESISKSILDSYTDAETLKILNASIGEPWTISEMLEKLNISKTSGYRKISILIEQGLLIKSDYEFTPNTRKIDKYKSLFDNVKIDITNNKVTINVQFTQDIFAHSSILKTIYGA